jgi:hypothetical protein
MAFRGPAAAKPLLLASVDTLEAGDQYYVKPTVRSSSGSGSGGVAARRDSAAVLTLLVAALALAAAAALLVKGHQAEAHQLYEVCWGQAAVGVAAQRRGPNSPSSCAGGACGSRCSQQHLPATSAAALERPCPCTALGPSPGQGGERAGGLQAACGGAQPDEGGQGPFSGPGALMHAHSCRPCSCTPQEAATIQIRDKEHSYFLLMCSYPAWHLCLCAGLPRRPVAMSVAPLATPGGAALLLDRQQQRARTRAGMRHSGSPMPTP